MALQLLTAPYSEPIDIAEVRQHVRRDDDDDDLILTALIGAAREYAEGITNRQIMAARYVQTLDSFPGPTLMGVGYGHAYTVPGNAIKLLRSPVLKVDSINYIDMSGNQQTMATTDYLIRYSDTVTIITPPFGKIWPIPMPQIGSVWVTFDAGYATPFTADATAHTIAVNATWPAYTLGQVIKRLSNSGGALPTPLKINTDYYVVTIASPGVYQISTTPNGSPIAISDIGSGTNYLGIPPPGINAWMKIRLGSLYENREEVANALRGKLEPMPYINYLLDPYKIVSF